MLGKLKVRIQNNHFHKVERKLYQYNFAQDLDYR